MLEKTSDSTTRPTHLNLSQYAAFSRLLSRIYPWVVVAGFILYFTPFLILRENSYITIHDNLDETSGFLGKRLLISSGQAFNYHDDSVIPNIMNGLPRRAMRSALDLTILPFYFLTSCDAYILNHIVVHLLAFLGAFLLFRKFVFTSPADGALAILVALGFATVPFYTQFGASVAGQPLLLFAFFNILRNQSRWTDYLIIVLFPFYSWFVFVGPFIVVSLLTIWAVDAYINRSVHLQFLGAVALFSLLYVGAEFQLFRNILVPGTFVSHRVEWSRWNDFSLHSNARRTIELFFETQYHTGSFRTILIIITALTTQFYLGYRKIECRSAWIVCFAITAVCIFAGFYDWFDRVFTPLFSPLRYFNASRFYFLLPLLWFILFSLNLRNAVRLGARWIPVSLAALQIFVNLHGDQELRNNIALLRGRIPNEPTYSEFFDPPLFSRIRDYIGRPQSSYRVVSLGIHPSVAQYNGFYTLDSYNNNYPLEYKHTFRKIIAAELAKNDLMRSYFDGWGNRCYLYSNEIILDFQCGGTNRHVLKNFQIDTRQLRSMGGEYVISAVRIENCNRSGLRLEREFSSPGSYWDIYLYDVL